MKKKSTFKPKFLMTLVILILISSIISLTYFKVNLAAPQKESETVEFVVVAGDTVDTVLKRLKDTNLIKDEFSTKIIVKVKKLNHLKVGGFLLDKSWSAEKIMQRLNDLPDDNRNTVKITFKEGIWARDFAKLISEKTSVSAESLLELWNDTDYLKTLIDKYPFLTDAILNPELKVKLEGYLAPNTYEFYINTTPEAVTERLLNQTKLIYEKYQSEFEKSEYSIHELFTLASITQFESGNDSDNKIISGIWYNRLNRNMYLQSSVTVCYAIYDYKSWHDCERQTNVYKSPYNTYLNHGIPIGPVSAPGESALVSVLRPEKSDYLYFIAAVYTDGKIHYAKTYNQHRQNIAKYLDPYQ